MKSLLIVLALTLSSSAFSAVLKSRDVQNKCTLYRATRDEAPKYDTESIVTDREVYGLSLHDLDIDFNKREARLNLLANIVLGANINLNGAKVRIPEGHPDFKNLVNKVNRKIILLEKACVDKNNVLVYASEFEQ